MNPRQIPNGGLAWGRLLTTGGISAFLLAYILGAIPFLPSPVSQLVGAWNAQTNATAELVHRLDRHDRLMRYMAVEQLNASRETCRGVWILAKTARPRTDAEEQCGPAVRFNDVEPRNDLP